MTASTPHLQLMLIDENATFRAGMCLWLEQFPEIDVVSQWDDGMTALRSLDDWWAESSSGPAPFRLVAVSASLGSTKPDAIQGLALCRLMRDRYPTLPILLLGTSAEPVMVAAAQQAGASGFCPRQTDTSALLAIMRRVAYGQSYWPAPTVGTLAAPRLGLQPGPFSNMRRSLRVSGIEQIEQALAEITAQLRYYNLPSLERAILAGRRRELLAARWLVRRILATPELPEISPRAATDEVARSARAGQMTASTGFPAVPAERSPQPTSQPSGALQPVTAGSALATESATPIDPNLTARGLRSALFDEVMSKLQTGLDNRTNQPIEIDILRTDKKRELFYLILRKLEELLDELRFSQVEPDQLVEMRSQLLLDLWEDTTTEFFGKYYMVPTVSGDVELVSVLLLDAPIVERDILNRIPLFPDWLAHLLFQTPLVIDGVPYTAGNPESMLRSQLLLSHLMVQVANAVVQPLLNRVADFETIKQAFYDRRLLSSREIERFRNHLSWRYRVERYLVEPRNIFESQYQLFSLHLYGIQLESIYAPRRQELEGLEGLPYLVTLALETRDAIAPRVRAAVSVVGSGLVYLLTEVIGRGIGLVGRGIAKGVGNVWQDNRYPRNGERPR
ncbi:DUF3685 domain-containing protein [Leptolyngbya sp. AN02str]